MSELQVTDQGVRLITEAIQIYRHGIEHGVEEERAFLSSRDYLVERLQHDQEAALTLTWMALIEVASESVG